MSGSNMNELPDDVLALIFGHFDFYERKDKLPLVCKRFASLLARPSWPWKEINLTIPQESRLRVDAAKCLRWFGTRRPAVEDLQLIGAFVSPSGTYGSGWCSRGSFFGAALLSSLSPGLRRLRLNSVLAHDLYVLAPFTQLEELDLGRVSGLVSAACIQPLRQLQRLKCLSLQTEPVQPPGMEPVKPAHRFLPQILARLFYRNTDSDQTAAALLADAVGSLVQLDTLLLEGFHESQLPAALSRLTNLADLSLNNCEGVRTGRTLHTALSGLTKLKTLHLHTNLSPAALPVILGAVSAGLEDVCLIVKGNDIVCLPNEFAGYQALKTLQLRLRGLQAPNAYAALASLPLVSLDLSFSDLVAVPATVRALTTLKTLILSGNYGIEVPEGPYLAHLERLMLDGCGLLAIPRVLQLASRLAELDLSDNDLLQFVPSDVILVVDHLRALRRLYLKRCGFGEDPITVEGERMRCGMERRRCASLCWVRAVQRRQAERSGRSLQILI